MRLLVQDSFLSVSKIVTRNWFRSVCTRNSSTLRFCTQRPFTLLGLLVRPEHLNLENILVVERELAFLAKDLEIVTMFFPKFVIYFRGYSAIDLK